MGLITNGRKDGLTDGTTMTVFHTFECVVLIPLTIFSICPYDFFDPWVI